ncbi:MAG: MBL fold metallo-hydrolase [Fervidicoccaceae archaeon]
METDRKDFLIGNLKIVRIPHGILRTNSYLIYSAGRKSAILIDPGENSNAVEEEVKRSGLEIKMIVLTHGHFDHACAAGELARSHGAKIAMSSRDLFFLDLDRKAMESFGLKSSSCSFWADIDLSNENDLSVEGLKMRVLRVPGHSPGSVSFLINDGEACLTGDTLFRGFVGRTDFPGGSEDELKKSLRTLVDLLGDQALILPGHGPETSMKNERKWLLEWIGY